MTWLIASRRIGRCQVLVIMLAFATSFLHTDALAAADWNERYDQAQASLRAGQYAQAAEMFDALALSASTESDKAHARELGALARNRLAEESPLDPKLRTSDELSLLYTSAFLYGAGTSAWLTLQVEPSSTAGALIPSLALTAATVSAVGLVDRHQPFTLGVPHAISSGMFIGLGQSILLVGYERSRARRLGRDPWNIDGVATLSWSGATLGAASGLAVGSLADTATPGRVSFVTSGALWGGLISAFVGAAVESREGFRNETAFLSGGIGLTGGLVASWIASRPISVSRVRIVDLGGLGMGLLSTAGYLLAAGNDGNRRGTLAAAAGGSLAGLGLAWWATEDMPTDGLDLEVGDSAAINISPVLTAVHGGWVGGVGGSL